MRRRYRQRCASRLIPPPVGSFSFAITNAWELPTVDGDGSSLGTLTSQRIYFSRTSGFTKTTAEGSYDVSAAATTATVPTSNSGAHYYALTATTAAGESELGPEQGPLTAS